MAVAAMAQDNDDPDLESSLLHALRQRSGYLRGQADLLTLPAVRRLLEKDLGLEDQNLDSHKSLIKGLVDKVLNEAEDTDIVTEKPRKKGLKTLRAAEDLQNSEHVTRETDLGNSTKKRKLLKKVDTEKEKPVVIDVGESDVLGIPAEKPNKTERDADKRDGPDNLVGNLSNGDEEPSEDQGVVQDGTTNTDQETLEEGDTKKTLPERNEEILQEGNTLPQDLEDEVDNLEPSQAGVVTVDENAIKLAFMRRADELKSQAESLTLTTVRHLLEEDLGLGLHGLDVHKQFIRRLVDKFLGDANEESIAAESNVETEANEEAQDSSPGRPKKQEKVKTSVEKKIVHDDENEQSEEKLQGNEGSDSASEERKPSKVQIRKKKTTEAKAKTVVQKKNIDVKRPFSPNVERLREILKAVGIGVSPIVYKKAKQAPLHERDDVLIKELENRLRQEGLSPNPTEKEIRKVKTRLEKKKDLDGIECSNIVEAPRRSRAAANSWFTPRPNKYSQAEDQVETNSDDQDSDDDTRPKVTGAMDD